MALNSLWVQWLERSLGSGATSGSGSDDIATETDNTQTLALNYGFDGTTWDRLRSSGTDSDNVASLALGVLNANNFLMGFDGTTWDRIKSGATNADGAVAFSAGNLRTFSQPFHFNGTTYDRERGNTEEIILASAARTATESSADFTNYNAKGIKVVIDVTADPATASVVFDIEGKDPISGNYYPLLTSAAIVAVGTTILTVFPGVSETANIKASDVLPRTYRVTATHADADSITYSVSGALVI